MEFSLSLYVPVNWERRGRIAEIIGSVPSDGILSGTGGIDCNGAGECTNLSEGNDPVRRE